MASKIKIRFSLISSGRQSEEKQIFLVCTIDGLCHKCVTKMNVTIGVVCYKWKALIYNQFISSKS